MASTNPPRGADALAVRTLARGSGIGIVGTALSQVSMLLIVVLLAASGGASSVGVYSQAFAIFTVTSLVTLVGAQTTLTRYVADRLVDAESHPAVRRLITYGTRGPVLAGLGTSAALVLLAPAIGKGLLDEPDVVVPLSLMALGIPFASYSRSAAAALQGFGEVRQLVIITMVLEPALRLLLTAAAVLTGFGVEGASLAILVSNIVAAVYARVRLRRTVVARLTEPTGTGTFDRREVLRFTILTSAATVANIALLWADTIILGAYLPSSTVGVYQLATRILAIASLAGAPIAMAFAPQIADLLRRQAWERLSGAYSLATIWSTRLAIPAISLCVVAPRQLADLIGHGSGVAVGATLVLAVGKLVEAATGSCGMILNMSHRVGLNALNNVVALTVNVVLNLVLIPVWGLVGAAVAWSAALILLNVGRSVEVRLLLGAKADNVRVLKTVLLGLPALGAGWLIMHELPNFAGVVLAGLAILAICASLYRILDWTYADTQVVSSLRGASQAEVDLAVQSPSTRRHRSPQTFHSPHRWAPGHASAGQTFAIHELVSPLRLDVWVRAEFFTFIRAHRELIERDWDRFIWLARQQPYHVWFHEIALEARPGDRHQVDQYFQDRVRRSIVLLNSWEEHGFRRGSYIQMWRTKHPRPTASGKLVTREFYLGDGCHRLALLLLDGVTELTGDHVRIGSRRRFAPRDNTSLLLARLPMAEADYLAFISRGYGMSSPATDRGQLMDAARRRALATELSTVLQVDDRARALRESDPGQADPAVVKGVTGAGLRGWGDTRR